MDRYIGLTTREKARRILDDVLEEMRGAPWRDISADGRKEAAVALIESALRHHQPQLPAARSAA